MTPSYLERYRNGEREQVWEELIALGEAVRQEPVYSDARAVAQETMQRARQNIDTIYQRLKSIGYRFQAEQRRPLQNPLDGLRDQLAGNALLESAFGRILGNLEALSGQLEQMFPAAGQPAEPPRAVTPPTADIREQLDEFEREIGRLPLSVRAWCEIVGSVNFMGDHPGLASYQRDTSLDVRGMLRGMARQNPQLRESLPEMDEEQYRKTLENSQLPFSPDELISVHKLMQEESDAASEGEAAESAWFVSDPLAFDFYLDVEEAAEMIEEEESYGAEAGRFDLMAAPDALHKANISGSSYDIRLPDPSADAPLLGTDQYFVAYLRESFAWGGFPGLKDQAERDDKLLAFLKEGLLPI